MPEKKTISDNFNLKYSSHQCGFNLTVNQVQCNYQIVKIEKCVKLIINMTWLKL